MPPAWNIHACRCGHGKAIHYSPDWKAGAKCRCRYPNCRCRKYTRKDVAKIPETQQTGGLTPQAGDSAMT